MIVALLFGGPHDGRVVAAPELTPLVFPVQLSMFGVDDADTICRTVTYVPKRDTLQLCSCAPGWAHLIARPSMDLTSITYSQHYTCAYYPAGWRG
jgi:hypothetical protein